MMRLRTAAKETMFHSANENFELSDRKVLFNGKYCALTLSFA